MGRAVTKQAIEDLKYRAKNTQESLDTLAVTNEILTLINAYEKQIELNRNQNIKIKNQRGIIKVLQSKLGDKR